MPRFHFHILNGKYLYEWSFGEEPSDIHLLYIGADRTLWAYDRGTSKMLHYDLEGHFLYSFGAAGDFPGGFWGVHGFSVVLVVVIEGKRR